MTIVNQGGMPITVKASVIMWILGGLFGLIVALVGVVYSNTEGKLEHLENTKASLDRVEGIEKQLGRVEKGIENTNEKLDKLTEALINKRK
jgi:hypothetical protein